MSTSYARTLAASLSAGGLAIDHDWLEAQLVAGERMGDDQLAKLVAKAQEKAAEVDEGGQGVAHGVGFRLEDGLANINIRGVLFREPGFLAQMCFGATGYVALGRCIQALDADPAVRAIVLDLDTFGGEAAGLAELAHVVMSTKTPVIGWVSARALSAGVYLGVACDYLAAAPDTKLGSIGVVSTCTEVASPPGVTVREYVATLSPNKRVKAGTEAGDAQIQALVDDMCLQFLAFVADRRGLESPEVAAERFGYGGSFLAPEALKLGLIDAVSADRQSVIEGFLAHHAAQAPSPAAPVQPWSRTTTKFEGAGVVPAHETPGLGAHTQPQPKREEQTMDDPFIAPLRESLGAEAFEAIAGDGKNVTPEQADALLEAHAKMQAAPPPAPTPAQTAKDIAAQATGKGLTEDQVAQMIEERLSAQEQVHAQRTSLLAEFANLQASGISPALKETFMRLAPQRDDPAVAPGFKALFGEEALRLDFEARATGATPRQDTSTQKVDPLRKAFREAVEKADGDFAAGIQAINRGGEL